MVHIFFLGGGGHLHRTTTSRRSTVSEKKLPWQEVAPSQEEVEGGQPLGQLSKAESGRLSSKLSVDDELFNAFQSPKFSKTSSIDINIS